VTHLALDLGLRTTGLAWGPCDYTHDTCPTNLTGQARAAWWMSTLRGWLVAHPAGVELVVEMGFLHPKHPSGSKATQEMHGWLQAVAVDNDSPVTYVTPSVLKKWATGRGNATKDEMRIAAIDRWGAHHDITADEADALHLWHWKEAQP
jgi:Holliday junction resolvasome RuvABC endonuclease subunit